VLRLSSWDSSRAGPGFPNQTGDPTVTVMIKQLGDRIYYLGPDDFSKLWREEHEYHNEPGKIFKK
jgi:hypothetical protein